jgi:enoyl-CoA hydratase/carnithine racemase
MIDTQTTFETIALQRPEPGVIVATLNRPDRLNAMTFRMFYELAALPRL